MFLLKFDSIYSKWLRYGRKVLLQFREICVDNPDDLPPLETFDLTLQIRPYSRLPSGRPAIPSASNTSPSLDPIQHVGKGKGKAKSRKKLPVPPPTVPSEACVEYHIGSSQARLLLLVYFEILNSLTARHR